MSHGISHTLGYKGARVFRSRHGAAHTIANLQQVSAISLKKSHQRSASTVYLSRTKCLSVIALTGKLFFLRTVNGYKP